MECFIFTWCRNKRTQQFQLTSKLYPYSKWTEHFTFCTTQQPCISNHADHQSSWQIVLFEEHRQFHASNVRESHRFKIWALALNTTQYVWFNKLVYLDRSSLLTVTTYKISHWQWKHRCLGILVDLRLTEAIKLSRSSTSRNNSSCSNMSFNTKSS